MSATNLDTLRDAATALAAHGYLISEERFYPAAFGNAMVVLKGSLGTLRLTSDRSQWFSDVSAHSDPSRWVDAKVVLNFAENTDLDLGPWATAQEMQKRLNSACPRVATTTTCGWVPRGRVR